MISTGPVLRLEAVCAAVIIFGVVNDEGGDGAALVLVGANGELLAVCELAVQRVPPGEHWGRLSPAPQIGVNILKYNEIKMDNNRLVKVVTLYFVQTIDPVPDLPEGGPPGADCLGAGLALVDGRGD